MIKGIKMKVLLPLLILSLFFLGFMVTQVIFTTNNLKEVRQMNSKYFYTSSKVDDLKLDVVEVQQLFTDIGATKETDEFEDAEKYSQDFESIINDLKEKDPENSSELDEIEKSFKPYYETGKKMAQAYVDEGTEKGNLYMRDFDSTADKINSEVDKFNDLSNKNIEISISNIEKSIARTIILIGICALALLIVLILIWRYISNKIVNPITIMLGKLKEMANNGGDLTKRINFVSNDEIGEMAENFNLMQESFREIIRNIIKESNNVESKVQKTNENIEKLASSVEEIFATTEELSNSMEETAASTEEMSQTTDLINDDIHEIATKAKNEAENSKLIKDRADELKNTAVNSMKSAKQINDETQNKLLEAIEKSKEVEKIKVLSEAILEIAAQTNLLALNASIEASRAGEAGKGFSVVAGEIGKLAEDSKNSVSEISQVSDTIMSTVENLVSTAQDMTRFINTKVINDYEMIVKTGEQYSGDAYMINDMTTEFSSKSSNIMNSMVKVVEALKQINDSNNELTSGTNNIAENMNIMSEKSSDVVGLINEVSTSMNRLVNMVNNFKV